MIVVIATLRARTGKDQELADVLKTLVAPTRREKGCIQYDLHVADNDVSSFAFYERWADQAAFDEHMRTPHLAAALAEAEQLLDGPPSIIQYRLVT